MNNELSNLRNYQQHGLAAIRRDLCVARSTVWVCPTGGGKTRVIAALAAGRRRCGSTLVLCDRIGLVEQLANEIRSGTNLTVEIEQCRRRVGIGHPPDVVCALIQSLRGARLDRFPRLFFSTIVIDEADLGIASSYLRVAGRFHKAKIAGFTATPDRADHKPLRRLFEKVAGVVNIVDLIRQGYLCRIEQVQIVVKSVELDHLEIRRGDFVPSELGRVLAQERPLHAVVRPALLEAGQRPTLVFAADIAHSNALVAMFNRYRRGCARVVHTKTGEQDGPTIESFRRREFQFLVNVAKLTRGIDLPLISCVVMARPTKSRPLYSQMVGRGTRIAEGKDGLRVLDFVGNSERHLLTTVVDLLGDSHGEEARELARARLGRGGCGGDVLIELDKALVDLMADPALRERVRARVEYRTLPNSTNWEAQPLGKVTDAHLARALDMHPSSVTAARKAHGIEKLRDIQRRALEEKITRAAQAAAGTKTITQIAKEVGVIRATAQKVQRRCKLDIPTESEILQSKLRAVIDRMGKDFDHLIAMDVGTSTRSVQKFRSKHKIPPCPHAPTSAAARKLRDGRPVRSNIRGHAGFNKRRV